MSLTIQYLTWWFHLYWFICIDNKNFNRGRGNGDRQQLINSNHKGKHKIVCYPIYLLIFTACQVQGWWTMIIIPVKYQPYCSNVAEILLNISLKTHLKYSNPYIFILPKSKNPPDVFCTHLLFSSAIILIFGWGFYIGPSGYSKSISIG